MRYILFSFTRKAAALSSQLHKNIIENGDQCISYTTVKQELPDLITKLEQPLSRQLEETFHNVDAIIFVSACAIAVRSIAPFLESKTTDPAVIVIDELGQYAISLLSGHIGGGNELTKQVADWIHATPIISTATDLNNLCAVDVFATKNNMFIDNMKLAKQVSSDILDGQKIGLYSDFSIESQIPNELIFYSATNTIPNILKDSSTNDTILIGSTPSYSAPPSLGIIIGLDDSKTIFQENLHLIPKIITLGIGCKKGTPIETIKSTVLQTLSKHNISIHAVKQIASIDLKANEEGLLTLCQEYRLPFITNSAEELASLEGDFTPSSFVQSITGVNNVCERAALYQKPQGKFIIRKTAENGVTIAAVISPYNIVFDF
ncbi:cobalt-precorrin 5A hydrolase [Anaerosporobacter sp.]|uniref:cobalt-precorrin 5A hydrolase n=1 Tax=Anaerosporobacter sp. TaxID=1872529 RepID=UPI00286EC7C9|nr:cobalt-precorrin 5A hydrolase [Anaerosporobacter sp.]